MITEPCQSYGEHGKTESEPAADTTPRLTIEWTAQF